MLGQVAKANRLSTVAEAKEDHAQTDHNHHDNGGDFDHREPELNFTVQTHGGQVCERHQPHGDQCGYPLHHVREPKLDVDSYRGDLRYPHRHPHKPVRPGREIAKERAHVFVRVNGE
ncbi:hypothetical protein D3C86_1658700 [compost metagenome]